MTSLEPRNKVVGRPTVRQDVGTVKIGGATRITKPTFGSVTSEFF